MKHTNEMVCSDLRKPPICCDFSISPKSRKESTKRTLSYTMKATKILQICTFICHNSWLDHIHGSRWPDWVPTRYSPPSEGSPAPMTGSRYNKPAGGTWHISRTKTHTIFCRRKLRITLEWSCSKSFFFEPGQFFTINASDLHRFTRSTPSAKTSSGFLKTMTALWKLPRRLPGAAQKWRQWTG